MGNEMKIDTLMHTHTRTMEKAGEKQRKIVRRTDVYGNFVR